MTLSADIDSICNDEVEQPVDTVAYFSFDRAEFAYALEHDMDLLAGTAMPDTCTLLFPPTFKIMWELCITAAQKTRGFDRIYLGIPRGFCKTTFLRLLTLYIIGFTERNFVLITNATGEKAVNSVDSVQNMLDEPNIVTTIGNWRDNMTRDTQDCKTFRFRGKNMILAGVGINGSIRGLNIKDRRPDVMIYDDIQDWDNAESVVQADELLTLFTGTVMKAASKFRCLHLFVGNMYPFPGSILRKLKNNPTWTGLIVGGLLADGESFWPELQSKEQLLEEYLNDESLGKGAIFLAEILNDDSAMVKSGVDTTLIPIIDSSLFSEPHQGGFIIIDPSGRKKKSNNTEIGAFLMYDGLPYFRDRKYGVMSPKETIKNALSLCATYNIRLIGVEAVAYQETLLYWFGEVMKELHIDGIELIELYPGGISKNARIVKMFTQLVPDRETILQNTAAIMLGPEVRSGVIDQITNFRPLKTDNTDDLLDILAYVYKVIENFGEYIAAMTPLYVDEDTGTQVYPVEFNSIF